MTHPVFEGAGPQAVTATVDANEAVASVAYRLSEVIAIYPITPASPMGEWADEWAAHGRPNLWGAVPRIIEMQSEAGAIAAVHGAIQSGALATSFTASQGLLLMIPNLYKIAGELTPFCLHVAARAVATHALSIFGDHSDVMACRATGFAMLCSASVQEAQDLACVAHLATLRSRIPFLHFFDGFRTSHEIQKIVPLRDEELESMLDAPSLAAHRARALTPDRPVIRGTSHNPDTYFQAREAVNPHYQALLRIVAEEVERFAARTGRHYPLYEFFGHPEAQRVLVVMGSGSETAAEAAEHLAARGERVGVVRVRMFLPFDAEGFLRVLPPSTEAVAVLDRTKEPGAIGEPLFQQVATALYEASYTTQRRKPPIKLIGGRFGLAGKEFTPAMVQSVFEELAAPAPHPRFTVGITDDVSGLSLPVSEQAPEEPEDVFRAVFYGLGSDGTVSANKSSLKILGEHTPYFVQGAFVYDSKKAGAMTISHLRISPHPIRSAYLIRRAQFVACHQFPFLARYDILRLAQPGATLLLNAPYRPEALWDHLPAPVQQAILDKRLRVYAIDAHQLAREVGLGVRINTIMQTCFFALTDFLPFEEAAKAMKEQIRASYGAFGENVVERNFQAVEGARDWLSAVPIPSAVTSHRSVLEFVPAQAPEFVRRVTAALLAQTGDQLPVSAFPPDGTWPTGTARWEKRRIAQSIPIWDPAVCIQCNKCALVCPHAAIRTKVFSPEAAASAPAHFRRVPYKGTDFPGFVYSVQVAPEDCTGCELCVQICPAKDRRNPRHKALEMEPLVNHWESERRNYDFFLSLPEADRTRVHLDVKGAQFFQPLFEYPGACAGCGETPYIKLLTQLFGDRILIANATGCSSIYGGNLPTSPYTTNAEGRGPAWSNSLFEDNAEFGLGMRLALDHLSNRAQHLLRTVATEVGERLVEALLHSPQDNEAAIAAQRARVAELRQRLARLRSSPARELQLLADYLVRKSVWIVGGDGWAYDIGFAGLDHVLASGLDVNVLVLDTEVYSNTGGQQSKATPLGAAAKFASAGKETPKKDLGLIAMAYGNVYVARIALLARDQQATHAFLEAESFPGPSLLLAYSHCIAHGYDLRFAGDQQRRAVQSGYWPVYRFDPRRLAQGLEPLQLDTPEPKIPLADFAYQEARFRMVEQLDAVRFRKLLAQEQEEIRRRFRLYQELSRLRSLASGPSREEPS